MRGLVVMDEPALLSGIARKPADMTDMADSRSDPRLDRRGDARGHAHRRQAPAPRPEFAMRLKAPGWYWDEFADD
jgi:hypothetical protein